MSRYVRFCWRGLALLWIAALYSPTGLAAHPCDVHKVQVQKEQCLKQHAENERNAAEQARKAAQAKEQERQRQQQQQAQEAQRRAEQQRQQEQARREAEARRQQAAAEAQRKAELQRSQEAAQREAEARKQQAAIEAQQRANAQRQQEAKRREDEARQRLEADKKREQEVQKQATLNREKKAEEERRLAHERALQAQKPPVPQPASSPKTLTVAAPQSTAPAANSPRTDRQLVCDISATAKVGDDKNISRCAVGSPATTIAGAPCSCFSSATGHTYGGVAREVAAVQANSAISTNGSRPPQSVAPATVRQPQAVSGVSPLTVNGQAVCDISGASKASGDTGVSRCAAGAGSNAIAGATCACFSSASGRTYGGAIVGEQGGNNASARQMMTAAQTANGQAICDISAAPKAGNDSGVSRCATQAGSSVIAGSACSCFSQASGRTYGGFVLGEREGNRLAAPSPARVPEPSRPAAGNDTTAKQAPVVANSSSAEIDAEVKRRSDAQKGTAPVPEMTNQAATATQVSGKSQTPASTGASNTGNMPTPTTIQAITAANTTSVTTPEQKKIEDEVKRRMALQTAANSLQTAGSTPQTVSPVAPQAVPSAAPQTTPSAKSFVSACGSGWQAALGQVHEIGNVLLTGVSFQSSCQTHDVCYARRDCKTPKNMCDNALYTDMVNDCSRAASGNRRQTCIEQAKNFFWLVQKFGDDRFNNARKSLSCSSLTLPDVSFPTTTAGSTMQSFVAGQGAKTASVSSGAQGSTAVAASGGSIVSTTQGNAKLAQTSAPTTVTPASTMPSMAGKRYPLDGPVTQGFNVPWSVTLEKDYKGVAKTHTGVDIAAGKGTVVRALTDGVVYKISHMGSEWGEGVVVREANGTAKAYLHVSPVVKEGSSVKAGQEIGKVWKDHLHYNVCTRVQFCERGALPTSVKNPELPGDPLFKDGPFVKP